jgi:hypothetical protein
MRTLLRNRKAGICAAVAVVLAVPAIAWASGQDKYVDTQTLVAPVLKQSRTDEHMYLNSAYHSDASMNSALVRVSDGAILTEDHGTQNPVRVTISPPSYNVKGTCHPYPNVSGVVVHTVTCLADW